MLNQVAWHVRYALIVIIVVVIIILLSRWTGKTSLPVAPSVSLSSSPASSAIAIANADVHAVVAEADAANTAAHTHTNPLDALIDVTTALATLNTAAYLAGKEPVSRAAGVPFRTLEHEMASYQRQLMVELQGIPKVQQTHTLKPLPKI